MFDNYTCSLDISSRKLACAVAKLQKGRIVDMFFETGLSNGIQEGAIVDSIDLVNSMGNILRRLRQKSGINFKWIYTNISDRDIIVRRSRAIIPLAERGNKVVTQSDIEKVNEQARILGSSLEEEIIHSIPFSYSLDSHDAVVNPLGLYSHRLEVDLFLICGKLASIQNLSRVVNQAGYEIKGLFFSGVALSRVIFGEEIKQGLNVLCDIGSDVTEILVFDSGLLRDVQILPVGGDCLTLKLSEELNIPYELAEDVKRTYASVEAAEQIKEDKEILVKKDTNYIPIKQKAIAEIITKGVGSICSRIKEATGKVVPAQRFDNFIATGRTVLLDGFLESLENTLGVSVKLGRITDPRMTPYLNKDALSGRKYLTYIQALGLIAQALAEQHASSATQRYSPRNLIGKVLNKVKEVYQEYF